MAKKRGLGRGLDSLIPPGAPGAGSGVTEVAIDAIIRNPQQPRSYMDAEQLAELADSIREHGVIQPLVVARAPDGAYQLIAGERRLEAARQAGLRTVPAVVRDTASDQELLELALIENLQRADLSPLEAARAYKTLADDFGLSHDEIAKRVGKQRTTVSNTLRLLKLAEQVQQALAAGDISEGHARALASLRTTQSQRAALDAILKKGLNVRQTEELVRQLSGRKNARPAKAPRAPEEIDLEDRFRDALGTKVSLKRGRKGGGSIVIHFYSDEELEALVERLLGEDM